MTNSAFHKLCYEFDLNYRYQDNFQEYCDNLGIMYIGFYGQITADTEDMKNARSIWKKTHKVWLKDSDEVNIYIDYMPFGGYRSDNDAQKVLSEYRKGLKK